MKKELHFLIYLILAILLFLGSTEDRSRKAKFFSKNLYFPLVNSIQKFNSIFDLKEENKILSEKLAKHTITITDLENKLHKIENANINYTIGNFDYILADIVGFKSEFRERCIITNKGLVDDVHLDNPVISNEGIVGKVISVSLNYSIILPLDNSRFMLGVMSKRNQLQGMMKSDIFGNSYMTTIKPGSDIKNGDIIVTSQVSNVFPRGFPVGVVTRLVENPEDVYISAKIKTFVNPTELDQVVILKYYKDKGYEKQLKDN
ncbi:MAG: rod shape-determining protein MreC [Candidatus Cloacimonetes bacterium]|nr:rod shape-determining protein MreC [Candidatus Cloacimonadota bacterium]